MMGTTEPGLTCIPVAREDLMPVTKVHAHEILHSDKREGLWMEPDS